MGPTAEEIHRAVAQRMLELKPAIDECERLQEVLELLEGEEDAAARIAELPEISTLLARGNRVDAAPIRRIRKGAKRGRDGRAPQGANKHRIIESVLDDPGVTATEIAERTGIKRTVVSATITRLKRAGQLEPDGYGVRVPPSRGA